MAKAASKTKTEEQKKKLKQKAVTLFTKGKLAKSLDVYVELGKLDPGDFRTRMKIAELLNKTGKAKESIAVYKKIAESYANQGFLIQAISVCKIVLDSDAADLTTKALLAELYGKRGMHKESNMLQGKPNVVPKPVAVKPVPPTASFAPVVQTPQQTRVLPPSKPAAAVVPVPEVPVAERTTTESEEATNWNTDDLLDELFDDDTSIAPTELPFIPLFSELEPEAFGELIDRLTPWRVPDQTQVCLEGQVSESMFVIAHGTVSVLTRDPKGQLIELARLVPGDFFGEIGLFTKAPRTASCVALGDAELLEIKRQDFDAMVNRFPRIKEVLHGFYCSRVLDTILAKSDLFGSLAAAARRDLIGRFEALEFQDGDLVVQEGETGDCLYMVRDGNVFVFTANDGQEIALAQLKPGDFFGEVALVSTQKRTASVRASGHCDLLKLDRSGFDWVVSRHPEVQAIVQNYLDARVEETIKIMT